MRISADPMVALRAAAVDRVNARYNAIASQSVHADQAHAAKRAIADSVIAGGTAPDEFAAEATLRGISSQAFAKLIATKPDNAASRELARQTELIAIAAAATPNALPLG